jgi:hypothetical protein
MHVLDGTYIGNDESRREQEKDNSGEGAPLAHA